MLFIYLLLGYTESSLTKYGSWCYPAACTSGTVVYGFSATPAENQWKLDWVLDACRGPKACQSVSGARIKKDQQDSQIIQTSSLMHHYCGKIKQLLRVLPAKTV